MKSLLLTLSTLFALLFSLNTVGGSTPQALLDGQVITPNPDVQPNSMFQGKSVDAWVESYLRWLLEGSAIPNKKIDFLPIMNEEGQGSGNIFEIEVKPGTALVLPIALWVGFEGDPELGVNAFAGSVTLDGQPIAEPNEDYYVGPTYVDPPIADVILFYEGLAVVIKPLLPGDHTINLYSSVSYHGAVDEFTNTWNITVTP
jgi:hypothetical protein